MNLLYILLGLLLVFGMFISGCTEAPLEDNTVENQELQNTEIKNNEPETITVSCPFERVDDPYPGACGRYIDQDTDGLCDLSQ